MPERSEGGVPEFCFLGDTDGVRSPAVGASWPVLRAGVDEIAGKWRAERAERQARRSLDPVDFQRLVGGRLPADRRSDDVGGLWRSVAETTRPICEVLRTLGAADPSVALVASMHPSVLGLLAGPARPGQLGVEEQRRAVFATAADGIQWGTITSEPGIGWRHPAYEVAGRARRDDQGPLPGAGSFRVTGDKHFGSGSGVTSFMVTTAVPEDEEAPTIFVLDVRDRPGTARRACA